MVLISEITEEAAKKEGEPKEQDGEPEEEKAEERPRDERKETEQIPPQPAEVDPAELAVPPAEDPKGEAPPQAGKMLYNEYALRVAYIMRSYLYMRQGGAAAVAAEGGGAGGCEAGEERCRAMLEVVRKESGRWAVSRVVLEHTHPLEPPPDPADIAAVSPSCLPFASRQHPLWPPRRSRPRPPRCHHRPPRPRVLLRPHPPRPNRHARFYHDFCKH